MFLLGLFMGPDFMNLTKPPDPSFQEGSTGPDSGPSGDPHSFSDEPGLYLPIAQERNGKEWKGESSLPASATGQPFSFHVHV